MRNIHGYDATDLKPHLGKKYTTVRGIEYKLDENGFISGNSLTRNIQIRAIGAVEDTGANRKCAETYNEFESIVLGETTAPAAGKRLVVLYSRDVADQVGTFGKRTGVLAFDPEDQK